MQRVWRHSIGYLSDVAARAEGFADREEFFAYWERLHGSRLSPETLVWAVEFFLLPEEDAALWEGAA